ncbi:sialidase family protein [Roseivirga echinicomitans]
MKLRLLAFLFLAPLSIQAQNDGLEFVNLFSSDMNEAVSCYRIPALITAKNGDLIAAIDERVPSCGDLKWSNDINIVIRRSKDNGKTWSKIESIVNYPLGKSASDPSFILDQITGDIIMFFNYMDLDLEKDVYYLKMVKSSDNGISWSSPIDITTQITKPEWKNDFKFITSGRGIQTSTGTLLHTLVNLANGLHVFGSDDHGENWYLIDNPILPADESKIVELNDGSWMINSRVNNLGTRFVHSSNDKGKTWVSKPEPELIDPSCNASIIQYPFTSNGVDKNILLFANLNDSSSRENLSIRASYDDGKTWTAPKTVYAGKSAYSSLSILKDGSVGLFFEKDNYTENAFVRLSLDWITDGRYK